MWKTIGRGIVIGLAAVAAGGPSRGFAQPAAKAGPTMPHPTVRSVFPGGLSAGGTVDVTVKGTDLEGATTLWFDHPGLKAFHLKGLTFRVACAPGTPVGHHDVRVAGTYGVSNARAFAVGDRPETREVEPNNVPAQATPVAVNSVVNGVIAQTDVDCFAFEGKKGQRVLCDLEAERVDSLLDATIRLYAPDGRELDESRDAFGADPFLDVTLPADGRYVLRLHDVVYKGSDDHHYRLTVTDGPHLDAVVPVVARAGEPTTFTLLGRNLGGTPAPGLTVDGLPLERKTVTLTPPASYDPDPDYPSRGYVPSAGAARRGFEFTLPSPSGSSNPVFIAEAVDPVVVEREPNGEPEQAQAVDTPCDISGSFGAPGDLDLYRFRARKGDAFWVVANAERIGSQAVPVFAIQKVAEKAAAVAVPDLAVGADLTEKGDPARFDTRTVDAAVRWVAPEDGLYQVAVNDLYGTQRGDARLAYRLNVRPDRPDFHLFLLPEGPNQPDAVTVPAGGRELASVLALRSDGFAGPIRVEAADLPAGVRCEPVVIAAGQSSAPVVFEAEAGATPSVGTVRLVGRARFGDRKDDVGYVSGVNTLGPDVAHQAVGGGVVWPLVANAQQTVKPAPVARLTRGFVVKVIEPAPLTLTARAPTSGATVTPGGLLVLDLTVTRRLGFAEAVAVSLAGPAAATATAPALTIPKTETTASYPLTFPKTVAPGVYTVVVQGSGAYPFSKDPNAKTKPSVTLTGPSNPLTVVVRPAPAGVTVNTKGGSIKAGGSLEVEVTVTPKDAPAAAGVTFAVALAAPAALKLSAAPVEAAPGKPVKLLIKAAADSPAGAAAGLALRVTLPVRGGPVDVNEPVTLTVTK